MMAVFRLVLLLACMHACSGDTWHEVSGDWIRVNPGATECNVMDYGAKGDGVADDTKAVQAALTACVSGGTVVLPAPHTFLTFGLSSSNAVNMVVSVQAGSTLRFSDNISAWNENSPGCLSFTGGGPIALTGGGLVDGQGYQWWKQQGKTGFRPGLLKASSVSEMLISNLTFIDSPNHTLELFVSRQEVVDTTIYASLPCQTPPQNSSLCAHNTDGIDTHNDIAGSAWVHRCNISTGDDNVAIHGNNTLVEDSVFGYGHGASIGSLGKGTYLQNITVRRVNFTNTEQATRIKSDPGASGYLRDVTYTDLRMEGVGASIYVTMYYPDPVPGLNSTLKIYNITFSNIVSHAAVWAGQFECAYESPCEQITVSNVQHTGTTVQPWTCRAAHGTHSNVTPPLCLQP